MNIYKRLMLGCVIACFFSAAHGAYADVSYSWNTKDFGGTGDWLDADHWDPKGSTPGSSDPNNTFVSINAPSSGLEASAVSLSQYGANISINSLTIGPRVSPLPPSIVGENSLNIGEGCHLIFGGSEANPTPQINNAGIINLRGSLTTGNTELDWTEIKGEGKILLLGTGEINGHFQNRQVIEGRGTIFGFMSNQGTIRATNGYVLTLYASTYNEGGLLTTDGWTSGETMSELLIAAGVEKGTIDANGGRVRFVTTGPIKDVTLTGGQMVFASPAVRFSGAVKINSDVVLSSTTGNNVGSTGLQLVDKATLENNGVIRFVDGAEGAITVLDKSPSEGSNATLTGTGRAVLVRGGPNSGDTPGVNVDPHSGLVHEANHTIEGSGYIYGGSITNKGQIVAKDGTLTVAALVTNSGTVGASPGGILELSGGSINKAFGESGNISPGGGLVRLTGATVTNGEWGPGNVEVYYSLHAIPAVTLVGNNHFSSGTVVDFVKYSSGGSSGIAVIAGAGTLTNDGTIRMNGPAELRSGVQNSPASTALLTGSGQLILAPGSNYDLPSLLDDGSCSHGFINDTNHTIRGSGYFRTPVENRGTIIVENGVLAISQPLTGKGSLQVKDSGRLSYTKDIQAGNLQLDADSILNSNDFGKTIELSGNFSFSQTDETKWTRGMPIIKMDGGQGFQELEIGSLDMGLAWDPFYSNTNFRLKKLFVEGAGTWVSLVDSIDNGNRSSPEVLYANDLYVNPGATLNLNGLTFYTTSADKLHLVMAGEGHLFGGGQIVNVPEPGSATLAIAAIGSVSLLLAHRRYRRYQGATHRGRC